MKPFPLVFSAMALACASSHTAANEIPKSAAHYFRSVGFNVPDLSPDGTYTATKIRKAERRDALAITNLVSGKTEVLGTHPVDDFGAVAWLDDKNLFVGYHEETPSGDHGMYRLDRDTLNRTEVTGYMSDILAVSASRPNGVWLYFSGRADEIVEVDGFSNKVPSSRLATANRLRSFDVPPDAVRFYAQPRGEVRFCLTQRDPKEKPALHWRPDPETDTWQPIPFDWYENNVLGVDAAGTGVFVTLYEGDSTRGLYRLDAASGTLSECLYRDPKYSLDQVSIRYSRRSPAIKGISYQAERWGTVWFDRGFQQLQAYIDRQLTGAHNEIVDWSDDESVFLISSSKPGHTERLLLLDLKAKRISDQTGRTPWVPRPSHAITERLDFTSRDGLALRAYLTKPAEASARNKVPLVVYFGDWPWEAESSDYHATDQWLAANGLATLRVNSRAAIGQVREISEKYEYDFVGAALDRVDALRTALADPALDQTNVCLLAFNASCHQALVALVDGGDLFRYAVMRDGHFRMRAYLDDVLKEDRPLFHAKLAEDFRSNPADSERFFHVPSDDDLRNVKAQVVMVLDRPLPPGTVADNWSVLEGEYTDEANFLIRGMKRWGGKAEIARIPFAAFDADYAAFTMEEVGKVLFGLIKR